MSNLLELLAEDGFIFNKVSSGKGGVYKGKCPWCGGTDRFTVYPNDGHGGGYICNMCPMRGDKVSYLRKYRNMTYFEACIELNIQPEVKINSASDLLAKKNKIHEPRKIEKPHQKWTEKTTGLLFAFYKNMMSAPGKKYRDYLQTEKSLKIETIQKARLSFNPTGIKFNKETFGLPADPEKNTAWIAAGIVIPYFENDKLIRLRVRQDNPSPGYGRYLMLSGSNHTFLIYPDYDMNKPTVIVESELDGWLLWQECGGIINIMASGSSSYHPCTVAHQKIKGSQENNLLFVWGDNDESGEKMNKWWVKNYSAIVIHTSKGEDVSDSVKNGLNLKEFIMGWISEELIENCYLANPDDLPFVDSKNNSGIIGDISLKNNDISIKLPEKRQIILENKKQPEIKPEIIEEIEPVSLDERPLENKIDNRNCYNTGFCGRLKDGVCLLNKKSIHDIDLCPEEPNPRWKRYFDSEDIESIIIMPQLKQRSFKKRN